MASKHGLSLSESLCCRACCTPVIDEVCKCGGRIERLCLLELTDAQIKILEYGSAEECDALEVQMRPETMCKAVSRA